MTPTPPYPAGSSRRGVGALQAFRGETRASARIHPLEKALVTVVCIHLCFMPWALGTMHVWSQTISLGFSIIEITLALINRHYDEETSNEGRFKLVMWPKLIRFPIFWLGLALLLYITIQGLNPSWAYRTNGKEWWMQPIDHIKWLPTGMETPFKDMNAWRMLMIYGSAWLLACSLWIGITRRKNIRALIAILVINGAGLAMVGIIQKIAPNGLILWNIRSSAYTFFSTFIYKNHAGAYFSLITLAAVSLSISYAHQSTKYFAKSNPSIVFGFLSLVCGIATMMTYSRAAMILLIGGMAVTGLLYTILSAKKRPSTGNTLLKIIPIAVVVVVFGLAFRFFELDQSFGNVARLFNQDRSSSVSSRAIAFEASFEMASDKIGTGWGAGSYRHYFPVYQQAHPEIYKPHGTMLRWEYAHNDYLQILAELGIVGSLSIWLMGVYVWTKLFKNQFYKRMFIVPVIIGLCLTLLHSWVDFQSYNPAVLLLWSTLAVLAIRWLEVEQPRLS